MRAFVAACTGMGTKTRLWQWGQSPDLPANSSLIFNSCPFGHLTAMEMVLLPLNALPLNDWILFPP